MSGRAGVSPREGKRIIALVAIVLAAVSWLILIDQVRFEGHQAVAAAVRQNENRAAAFQQYTLRTLDVANVAIDHAIQLYGSLPAKGSTTAAPLIVRDPVLVRPIFSAVYVTDAHGGILATTLAHGRGAGGLSSSIALPQPSNDAGHLAVSPPVRAPGLDGDYICLTRSFGATRGGAGGHVAILIKPTVFTDMAQGAAFSATDLISFVGLDGITRARRMGDSVSWGQNLAGRLVLRMQARHPDGHYVGPSGIDGIMRFFSHRRLHGYPLFVTSGVAVDAVFAPVVARERTYLLVASLLTIAIFVAAGMLIRGVSRRERQVEALAGVNSRLSEAQRVGLMGDWDYDVATDRLRWSAHLYEMYERSPNDEVSRLSDVRAYVSAADAEAIQQGIRRILTIGTRQEQFVDVTLPSGAESTRHIVAVPTRNAEGAIVGIHGTDHDVTAERKLRQIEARLAHRSRVDAMNAMASTLAHELNQPLAIATNYLAACRLRLVRAIIPPEPTIVEALDMATTQVRNAGEIIRGVRALVSGGSAPRQYVSLTTICAEATQLLRSAAPRSVFSLSCAIDPAADMILAVSVQIQQILMNLVLNAIDAASAERDLAIVIGGERRSDEIVAIRVTDNGRGLPTAADELFSAFFTTKETGLGLGLSICRTLVEVHGGEIAVEKTGPTGTTVRFTLASPVFADAPPGDHSPA